MVATAPAREGEIIEHGQHAVQITEPDERKQIALMDRMDLQQAMAELQGDVIQTFVYIAKGKRQLSYAGIKEAARLYKNVDFGATATPLADGAWMITSYAHNMADNLRCSLPMPYPAFNPANPGESIEYRANLSKSVRNALAAVLPVAWLNQMINTWLEQQQGGRQVQQAPRRETAAQSAPERQVIHERVTPTNDPGMAALRTELAEWFERYPDAKARAEEAVRAANAGGGLSDVAVRKAVTALRQRAADEEAQRQDAAQEAAVTDISAEERLAGALEVARATVTTLRGKRGGPNAGDYEGIRVLLREIQACAPLPDDVDPKAIPPRELLNALRARVLVAESDKTPDEARQAIQEADDNIPF